jgi:hypothetical protein
MGAMVIDQTDVMLILHCSDHHFLHYQYLQRRFHTSKAEAKGLSAFFRRHSKRNRLR